MKLKDYAKAIAELAKQYPDAKVLYALDDKGNRLSEVNFMLSDDFEPVEVKNE